MAFCRNIIRVEVDCDGATGVLGIRSYASSSVQPLAVSKEETDVLCGDAKDESPRALIVDSGLFFFFSRAGVGESGGAIVDEFVVVEVAEGGGVGGGWLATTYAVAML